MLEVRIPVHPLSRAIILSEYGAEPVAIEPHDILFEVINSRITPDNLRAQPELSSVLCLSVQDRRAAHLARYGLLAGHRLMKFHHHLLCRFVDAQMRAQGPRRQLKDAIQDFLNLYRIEEDMYSFESAKKLYGRFFSRNQQKNAHFVARLRRKPSGEARNFSDDPPKTPEIDALPAELAVSRFMSKIHFLMNRYHSRLSEQARAYIYVCEFGISSGAVAEKLGIPQRTVQHRCLAMRRRMAANPTYERLLAESLALPVAE